MDQACQADATIGIHQMDTSSLSCPRVPQRTAGWYPIIESGKLESTTTVRRLTDPTHVWYPIYASELASVGGQRREGRGGAVHILVAFAWIAWTVGVH